MTAAQSSPSLSSLSATDLRALAEQRGLSPRPHQDRGELLAALLQQQIDAGQDTVVEGVLELLPEGFGFLRYPQHDLAATPADPYVSPSQVRGLNLKSGHRLRGPIRAPKGNERFFALVHVDTCNDAAADALRPRVDFGALQPIVPHMPLVPAGDSDELRLLRALVPWQRGHRVLIDAPTGADHTARLARLALALQRGTPTARVSFVALAQRPEAIAAARTLLAPAPAVAVIATTFEQPASRHVAVAALALASAQRDVEAGATVLLLVDGLTALVRASQLDQPASGRWLCPGLDAQALQGGKQLFAAARAVAEGGSLSVFASVTRDADSNVDAAIAAEFRAFANSVVRLDAERVAAGDALPFDVAVSRTRPEDDAREAAAQATAQALRARLAAASAAERSALLAAVRS